MVPLATASPDVAQLSDTELVERIESALQSLESIEASKASAWQYFRRLWDFSRRWSALSNPDGFGRVGSLHPPLAPEPAARTHQALREIRELTDELERRVARDKLQRT